jgi:hypothetical protein
MSEKQERRVEVKHGYQAKIDRLLGKPPSMALM